VLLLTIAGKMTTNGIWANRLSATVRRALQEEHRRFLLDMRHVAGVDSSGLGDLIEAYISIKHLGGTIKLLHLTGRLYALLAQTKLRLVFECFEDVSEAFASFDDATKSQQDRWEDEGSGVPS
jgi:anti-anti-sigma factor